jgi:hypothetical protein
MASTCWDADGHKVVGDDISDKTCCGRVMLGGDPEKLIVSNGNEGGEGRGAEGNGVVNGGGAGTVRTAEAIVEAKQTS